jgi:hypothetical protein
MLWLDPDFPVGDPITIYRIQKLPRGAAAAAPAPATATSSISSSSSAPAAPSPAVAPTASV